MPGPRPSTSPAGRRGRRPTVCTSASGSSSGTRTSTASSFRDLARSVTLEVGALAGRLVRLEPLSEAHVDGLAAAAAEERSTYGFTVVPQGREATAEYVQAILALQ